MDFTQVSAGYRALRERAACIDLRGRGKIVMTGEDRARLLHAMATNHVEQLKPGEGCYTFFLNAQGRILADANILCFEDHFLLDTEPETRVKLFEHLDRYIIADDVTIEDRTEALLTISVEGPQSAAILQGLGAPIPSRAFSWMHWKDRIIAKINTTGSEGFFIMMDSGSNGFDLDIPHVLARDARTVRIENGRPRYGEEITERNLVQETDQLHAVHFSKGCYLGQEIVERVRSRAHIHRILRRLEIDTADPPAPGTKTEALEIASSAFSPALNKSVALAYVRMLSAEPGTELTVNGARAVVSELSPAPHPVAT